MADNFAYVEIRRIHSLDLDMKRADFGTSGQNRNPYMGFPLQTMPMRIWVT
jgi:hypothetical protein